MKTRRGAIGICAVAALALGLGACSTSAPTENEATESDDSATVEESGGAETYEAKDSYVFQVITLSNASPYWLAVRDGAEKAAEELGNIEIRFDAPKEDSELAQQIEIFNNAITADVDGILLAAQNPEALVEPIERAQAAGIPVVTIDSGVDPNVADSYLATDNVAAAEELAIYMAGLMDESGKYAIVNSSMQFTSGIERPKGFDKGMEQFANIESVGMQLSNSDMAKAQEQAANFMQANPDLGLIFGANDRSAIGVGNAIQAAGKGDEVLTASFDVNENLIAFMRDGVLQASLLQSPFGMGEMGVGVLMDIFDGKTVEKVIATPTFILTPENLDSEEAISAIQQYMPDYNG
ncbi:substrate-binding domain-containing protein [Actinomycetaceae bacterium MB13-C1-2]|nr:substrate-binding domain-containing protein [Actinomycetaceae bacterium MB13-C1-2]